ncbi:MAG: polysaccharide biosynthesis protein [Lachnospiraceae bacterium]|nr:polysaccharide biosynthesis protein [Lachnospiraceae bacterium]
MKSFPHKLSFLKNPLLFGTLLLTGTGILVRIIGFFYRIYLSRTIGAEGMGLYQLIFPAYNVCYALCCSSVQTAVSRFVAVESAKGSSGQSKNYLTAGMFLSLLVSLSLTVGLYQGSAFVASRLLLEPRCEPLLPILALALPFNAIHACAYGYYYGRKKAEVPALSQLFEQIVRVLVVVALCENSRIQGGAPTVAFAVTGLVLGEIAALLFSLVCLARLLSAEKHTAKADSSVLSSFPGLFSHAGQLLKLYLPLCANRLTINLLQSMEAVLIPGSLQLFGLGSSEALSLYGVFTGMSLPFILFPTAVTNSLAVMLLPAIAEAGERGDLEKISRTTGMTIRYCLYIGILFTGIFFCFGPDMGQIIFGNAEAGRFISILAWLCPFLYLSGTVSSILNGLGKAGNVFLHSLGGLSLRLAFVVFGIPRFGITAYLYGTLAGELLITALHVTCFCKDFPLAFRAGYTLIRPMAACVLCRFLIGALAKKTAGTIFGIPFFTLAAHCALFAAAYLLILFLTKNSELEAR